MRGFVGVMCLFIGGCDCGGDPPAVSDEPAVETTAAAESAEETEPAEEAEPDEASGDEVPPFDRDRWAEFREHVRSGVEASRAGELPRAITELDAALAIEPGAPQVLGELGWAAFRSGDLERATEATTEALQVATEPRRRAMLLYNLGRIAEARSMNQEAIRAYRRSLELRPNDTVRERVLALDPHALDAGRVDNFLHTVVPTDVVQSRQALCAGDEDGDEDEGRDCATRELAPHVWLVTRTLEWESCYTLALERGGRFWEVDLEACEGSVEAGSGSTVRVSATELGDVVRIDTEVSGSDMDWCGSSWWSTKTTHYCGAMDGRPVCWAAIRRTNEFGADEEGRLSYVAEEERTEADLQACTQDAVTDRVREAVPERAEEPTLTLTDLPDGQVRIEATGGTVPETLLTTHRIRALPCLTADPDPIFACPP